MESTVLIKVVDFVDDNDEVCKVEVLVLVINKVVDFVDDNDEVCKVEVLVLVINKVVDFVDDNDELGIVEVSVLSVIIIVFNFVVVENEKLVTAVLVPGVLIKTGELVGANVELMRVLGLLVAMVDVLVMGKVVSKLGLDNMVVASFVEVGKIVLIGDE